MQHFGARNGVNCAQILRRLYCLDHTLKNVIFCTKSDRGSDKLGFIFGLDRASSLLSSGIIDVKQFLKISMLRNKERLRTGFNVFLNLIIIYV